MAKRPKKSKAKNAKGHARGPKPKAKAKVKPVKLKAVPSIKGPGQATTYPAPDFLGDDGVEQWALMVKRFTDAGTMAAVDLVTLGLACKNYEIMLDAMAEVDKWGVLLQDAKGDARRNPACMVLSTANKSYLDNLKRLGIVDADPLDPPESDDKVDEPVGIRKYLGG